MSRADGVFATVLGTPFVLFVISAVAIPENWKPMTFVLGVFPLLFGLRLMVGGIRVALHPAAEADATLVTTFVRWLPRIHFLVLAGAMACISLQKSDARFLDGAWYLAVPVNFAFLLAAILLALFHLGRTSAGEAETASPTATTPSSAS